MTNCHTVINKVADQLGLDSVMVPRGKKEAEKTAPQSGTAKDLSNVRLPLLM